MRRPSADIGGRQQIAALIQIRLAQARPIAINLAAAQRAARKQHCAARAMIGARRAVFTRGAAKFGHRQQHGFAPDIGPQPGLQPQDRVLQPRQRFCQTCRLPAMGVPPCHGKRGNSGVLPQLARRIIDKLFDIINLDAAPDLWGRGHADFTRIGKFHRLLRRRLKQRVVVIDAFKQQAGLRRQQQNGFRRPIAHLCPALQQRHRIAANRIGGFRG